MFLYKVAISNLILNASKVSRKKKKIRALMTIFVLVQKYSVFFIVSSLFVLFHFFISKCSVISFNPILVQKICACYSSFSLPLRLQHNKGNCCSIGIVHLYCLKFVSIYVYLQVHCLSNLRISRRCII